MYKKISFKIISNITIFLLISVSVIALINMPVDLDFYIEDGELHNTLDFPQYKENIVRSTKIMATGEVFKHKIFGKSEDVGGLIKISLGRSMKIFALALILALIIGVPKGIFDSRRNNKQSNFKLLQTLIPLSVPDVLTISLVQMLGFYLYKNKISFLGLGPIMHIGYEHWTNGIYPVIALSLVPAAYIARITASSIEVVYDKDYILTARGKGCSELRIILNHTMRNILTDLIGSFPAITSIMFSSLFIVERIFYYPGIAFEMLALYAKPAKDGSTTIALLGLAMSLAITYFILYTLLEIVNGVLSPRLDN